MKKLLLSLLLALCCICSGCLGAVQADDYIYVVAIGFDVGEQCRYNISVLVQRENSSDGQSASGGAEVIAAEGDSMFEAITTMHAGGPFKLDFSRVNTIVMSEELMRRGDMNELADLAFNSIKLRQSVKLAATLCEAKSFLQGLCLENAPNITKLQFSVFENYSQEGITVITNYVQLMECIRGGRADAVIMLGGVDPAAIHRAAQESSQMTKGSAPEGGGGQEQQSDGGQSENSEQTTTDGIIRTGGMSTYVSGVALLDGWYMKGVLNGNDTKLLLLARGEFDRGNFRVPYGKDSGVIHVKMLKKPKVKLTLTPQPSAKVSMSLRCTVLQYMGDAEPQEWEMGFKEAAESYIEAELRRVFNICQKLNSDAMCFGHYASMQFSDVVAWEEYGWKAYYPALEADFSVSLELADENVTTRLE